MPTILRINGFSFYFFASDRYEPPHVHVSRGEGRAKFWLLGIELSKTSGFRRHELRLIEKIIRKNRDELLEGWNAYFGD
ncbi:MAG TPA: DUF4160 domain-containing protein [Candidatus Kapabacteria bacterium]|nr:DUF4160 domain-containing protein [Candidatus Kapabacteria bacterium]